MENLLVSYDVAVRLKEIGFDEPCMFFYRLNKLKISLNVSKLVSHSGALASSVSSDAILLSNHNLFNNDYSAPTYEQVLDWFRKDPNFFLADNKIDLDIDNKYYFIIPQLDKPYFISGKFDTHIEARKELVLKLIEIYRDFFNR